jgi:hypothetical protein
VALSKAQAPAMPAGTWSSATRSWWKTWARSEQARRFTPTAWQRLQMLVPLVEQFFKAPDRLLLYEIARHESKLGACPEDIVRLGWKMDGPKGPNHPDNVEVLYPDVELEEDA